MIQPPPTPTDDIHTFHISAALMCSESPVGPNHPPIADPVLPLRQDSLDQFNLPTCEFNDTRDKNYCLASQLIQAHKITIITFRSGERHHHVGRGCRCIHHVEPGQTNSHCSGLMECCDCNSTKTGMGFSWGHSSTRCRP